MKQKKVLFVFVPFFFSMFIISSAVFEKGFGVDFNLAMEPSKEYRPEFCVTREDWKKIRFLYDEYTINNLKYSEQPRIPKIIHQVWLGGPLPEECKILQKTWWKHHPEWEYKLWTEKEIEEFGLTNKHLYDEAINYAAKSDIARYEILYRIGGLYVDTDFECLKPFDIFNHYCNFYVGVAFDKDVVLFTGLIAAAPGHPVLKACIEDVLQMSNPLENGSEILERTGPYFFSRCFFKAIDEQDGPSVVFPVTYFYPWPYFDDGISYEQIREYVRPESYGIHHWHASWIRRD